LKTDKAITKEIKNEPKTLFPYTKKQILVRAGKRYFDEQNKNIHKIGGYYAMFSKEGNKAVTDLVKYAKEKKLNRFQVQQKMKAIEKIHPEIFDTEPRDMIYEKLFKISGMKKTAKKKAAPKKKAIRHKDTNSHNVKISVMSGISQHWLNDLNNTIKVINQKEKDLSWHKKMSTDKERRKDLKQNDKQIIAILKPQIAKLKKHLTQIKKHIK
jgi:hypothetical protein